MVMESINLCGSSFYGVGKTGSGLDLWIEIVECSDRQL